MKKTNKYILCFLGGLATAVIGLGYAGKKNRDRVMAGLKSANDKLTSFYYLLVWWVERFQAGHSVSDSLKYYGVGKAAIYGIKELGELTYIECISSGLEVPFFLDKCGTKEIFLDNRSIPVIDPNDISVSDEEIDIVIVTAITYFDEICAELSDKVHCPIVSLEELVYSKKR